MARTGRLIPYAESSAAKNMAIDQALLESVDGPGGWVLRLYGWCQPTVSLGYFQRLDDRRQHAESESLGCVRRSTGGGAIIHDRELTYSLTMPLLGSDSGPRHDLYRQSHQAAVEALADFGVVTQPYRATADRWETSKEEPFLCFQRRTAEDLIVSGYKILGSAQRKARRAVLQHGSLLLHVSRSAPQLPGVGELASRAVPLDQLTEAFTNRLAGQLSIQWETDELTASERNRATRIERERFANDSWLRRR